MMRRHITIGFAIAAVLAITPLSRADEQAVRLADLPQRVHQAVQREVGRGKIDSIDKITEDGEVTYDVEMTAANKTRAFTLDLTGKILELEVFADETPAAVRASITQKVGSGTLDGITKVFDDGVTYEVEFTAASRTRSFTVDEEGSLLETQVFLLETPIAVQRSIQKEVGVGKLGEITKVIEDAEVTYEAEITNATQAHTITFDEDGTVSAREIFLSELSAALQKSVNGLVGTAKLGEIQQSSEDGKTIYEVEIEEGSARHYTTIDANGAKLYREEDVPLAVAPAAIQTAVRTLIANGKLLGLSKTTEDGDISYDVAYRVAGKPQSASLDAEGKILPEE